MSRIRTVQLTPARRRNILACLTSTRYLGALGHFDLASFLALYIPPSITLASHRIALSAHLVNTTF